MRQLAYKKNWLHNTIADNCAEVPSLALVANQETERIQLAYNVHNTKSSATTRCLENIFYKWPISERWHGEPFHVQLSFYHYRLSQPRLHWL
jgi:hypothetical protein